MIASIPLLLAVTLELPASGQETYFFDLKEAKASSSTFELKTPAGEGVPFSFDPRVDFQAGEIRRPMDGWYSKKSAPAGEDRYRRFGWLSFRAPAGVSKCLFSFETGGGECVARPNPAVRPGWVELFKGRVPERIAGATRLPASDFVDVSSMGGRRIVTCIRTHSTPEGVPGAPYYRLALPNARRDVAHTVNNFYFGTGAEGIDWCCEGMTPPVERLGFVDEGSALFITGCCRSRPDKLPLCVDFLHIQAPPDASLGRPTMLSDLWYVGDTVDVSFTRAGGLVRVPFEASGFKGERVLSLSRDARYDVRLSLKDGAGRVVRRVRGKSISLDGVAPGRYAVSVEMDADGIAVAPVELPISVIASPWSREGKSERSADR